MTETHDPLNAWRDNVATAEGRLRNARDQLEQAAKARGASTSGLFSETYFVPRTTAERWVETAEQKFFEREKENFEYVKEALGALAAATKARPGGPTIPATSRRTLRLTKLSKPAENAEAKLTRSRQP